jgi:hypothetical protein
MRLSIWSESGTEGIQEIDGMSSQVEGAGAVAATQLSVGALEHVGRRGIHPFET